MTNFAPAIALAAAGFALLGAGLSPAPLAQADASSSKIVNVLDGGRALAASEGQFIEAALKTPAKGACEVLSPDTAYVNEMLVRFGEDGAKSYERRVALVIGNGEYDAFPDLKNPANDVASVARLLRALGFTVYRGVDLKAAAARSCLSDFYRGAEGAHTALLYYAGHGVSAGGVNALLPIDASYTDASESALSNALPVDDILAEMRKRAKSSLLFLDACRSSLGRGFEAIRPEGASAGAGAQRQTPIGPMSDSGGGGPALGGFYYVYAAAPNATAADGTGEHSPFTRAFLDHAATQGQLVPELVTDVTRDVLRSAPGQVPFADGSFTEDVYLNGDVTQREMALRSAKLAAASADAREQGSKGEAIAAALKSMPLDWFHQNRLPIDVMTRKELHHAVYGPQVYEGHGENVNDLAFSPDGEKILTASEDGTAIIWDRMTAKIDRILRHDSPVHSATFDPNGEQIVTATWNSAYIWDPKTGEMLRPLEGHGNRISMAGFSPNGERIVTASNDGTARIWHSTTGKTVRTLRALRSIFVSAAFSPVDNNKILTAAWSSGEATIWNATTGEELKTFKAPEGVSIVSANFRPDGHKVITALTNGAAQVWDVTTGQLDLTIQGHSETTVSAEFSRDGRRIVTSSEDRTARIWDAASGIHLTTIQGLSHFVNRATFSPDGEAIGVVSDEPSVWLWNPNFGRPQAALELATEEVSAATFDPSAKDVWIAADYVYRWDTSAARTVKFPYSGDKLALSPDGERILVTNSNPIAQRAVAFEIAGGDSAFVIERATSALYANGGRSVVTGNHDGELTLWSAADGSRQTSLARLIHQK